MTDRDLLDARVEFAERMAWLARARAAGRVLDPHDTDGWFCDKIVTGYAHDDSIEVLVEGPLRVMPVSERGWREWAHNNTMFDRVPAGQYEALIDVYWDVEPVGWTPKCHRTGEPLSSCWIFGPSVYVPRRSDQIIQGGACPLCP
jgi:hypothetical protein